MLHRFRPRDLRLPPCRALWNAGLPEEMRIVKMVTKAEYAAVAFSSADKQSRCWDAQWLERSVDLPAVGLHLSSPCAVGYQGKNMPYWLGMAVFIRAAADLGLCSSC